ncbi:4'-phosphopantetheinyl transferase family protein [Streptomyces coeruleoprunus]|uniref:4'-phosphopantetheinyl transferase family protein n=1 Tax=Streptomyces coeruleoprunus TaxID=285563 RepID=A0ABV9XBA6_9ACTN
MGEAASRVVEVHLLDWAATPWSSAEQIPGLPPGDLADAGRYTGTGRRYAAALARTLLRAVLGRALGVPGERLPLERDGRGRTVARRGADEPALGTFGAFGTFGISHDATGIAVVHAPGVPGPAAGAGCGVDVEDRPEREFADLAPRFGGPHDATAGRPRAVWTAKEAVAKALGGGLATGLRTLTFRPLPGTAWRVAHRNGAPTGHLVRTLRLPGRDLSVAAPAPHPPLLRRTTWTAAGTGGAALRPLGTAYRRAQLPAG